MDAALEHLRRLFAHLGWADARALAALRAMPAPDATAVGLLAHVLGAEALWLARIAGAPSPVAVWPALDLDGCERLAGETHAAFETLVTGLDDAARRRLVRYRNSAGQEFENPLEDILLHVALHGAYHRGQVAARVRAGGGEPLATDYIVFVRTGGA